MLIEHPAVAEAAVVPAPDPVRLAVPKAYVVLAAGYEPTPRRRASILRYAREHLAPYKRIRRLEFAELPKTISGKIRRVELRSRASTTRGRAVSSARRTSPTSRRDCQRRSRTTCPQPIVDSRAPTPRNRCVGVHKGGGGRPRWWRRRSSRPHASARAQAPNSANG